MNYGMRGLARRRRNMTSKARKRGNKIILIIVNLLLLCIIGAAALVLCLGVGAFRGMIDTAPDISNINVTPTGYSTFVYDIEGNQTAKLVSTDANRIPVTMDMVPADLQHAFVAIEDERFYEHKGIDIQGIIRAGYRGVLRLIAGHSPSEGASTITQQLIKNNAFTGWTEETFAESIRRKIQEQYLALELEKTMSKDDILLNYLNTINLGHNTLGVQAASLRYFDKPVSRLTLSECACIAGITQNPSAYDPIVYPEANNKRRAMVLDKMLENNWINQEQYEAALNDDVYSRIQVIDTHTGDEQINSYFVDALTDQVLNDLMEKGYTETQAYTLLYSGGLYIYSTQDPKIQAICDEECADIENYPGNTTMYLNYRLSVMGADEEVRNYSTEMLQTWKAENGRGRSMLFASSDDAQMCVNDYKAAVMRDGDEILAESVSLTPQPQISLTIEDQHTGNVVAIVGGRGDKTANRTLNRATGVMRQPGSTFKVVAAYAAALDSAGMTLATTQNDAPFSYEDGTPVRNWYGEAYRGLSSLRLGIQNSMNIVAVKTLTDITPRLGYEYLLDFGFTTLVESEEIGGKIYTDIKQPLALGGLTHGVKNIELNAAYATIANGGEYLEPKLYTKITDHSGNVILDASDRKTRRVLKETTAWLLTSAMEDVVTKGTGTMVNFGTTPIAGKTGTTSDENDVWFAGYTNYYTATTWAGCDENTDLIGSQANIAKIIWRACMERIHQDLPKSDFSKPAGIVQETVCRLSGKKPVQGLCGGTLATEFFDKDNLPSESCDIHYQGMICGYSGLPASDACPFKVPGVATYNQGGGKCEHTAEFMAQDGIEAIIAQQQAEIDAKNAQAEAAAQQQQLSSALDAANSVLQIATDTLRQAQDQLAAAQQSGDAEAIVHAQLIVQTAQTNYEMAVRQQAAAAQAAGGQ